MRLLVTIAHHGSKNRPFLLQMLDAFSRMDHDVDVVALCEEPKDLPPDVEQIVGLPTEDPWSLPFAHRAVFAERIEEYDLFVYSEDDTLIEQRHLDGFIEIQEVLPEHLITGFMRFETAPDGGASYCTIHSHYRWQPDSVSRFGGLAFARFTNDHAASYAVTQAQLRRAIDSGGFLVEPHQGRYDMLVSAATDIYTRCGFQKVMCLDRIDDQLVHHLPNVYLGKMGIDETLFRAHLDELRRLPGGESAPGPLLVPEASFAEPFWDRASFPRPPIELAAALAARPSRMLSVGATSGDPELELMRAGHDITAVPVDAVFAAGLQARKIRTLAPAIPTARDLEGTPGFDHILAIDLLPYLREPVEALCQLRELLTSEGKLVLTVPDHRRYALRNALYARKRVPVPESFEEHGVHRTNATILRRWLRAADLHPTYLAHRSATRKEPVGKAGPRAALMGNSVLAVARRRSEAPKPARVRRG